MRTLSSLTALTAPLRSEHHQSPGYTDHLHRTPSQVPTTWEAEGKEGEVWDDASATVFEHLFSARSHASHPQWTVALIPSLVCFLSISPPPLQLCNLHSRVKPPGEAGSVLSLLCPQFLRNPLTSWRHSVAIFLKEYTLHRASGGGQSPPHPAAGGLRTAVPGQQGGNWGK